MAMLGGINRIHLGLVSLDECNCKALGILTGGGEFTHLAIVPGINKLKSIRFRASLMRSCTLRSLIKCRPPSQLTRHLQSLPRASSTQAINSNQH
jgi:hypothetical protein